MIRSVRHKGLRRLYEKGDRRRVHPESVDKVERILARLDAAAEVGHMDLPGFRLDLAGFRSIAVSGNWRIIFRFEGGHAFDVDLIDYH